MTDNVILADERQRRADRYSHCQSQQDAPQQAGPGLCYVLKDIGGVELRTVAPRRPDLASPRRAFDPASGARFTLSAADEHAEEAASADATRQSEKQAGLGFELQPQQR